MIGGNYPPIDPEIKPLIIELNKNKFVTMGSCAGRGKYGAGLGSDRKGYIWFKKDIVGNDRTQVIASMKNHGCKDIRFTNPTEVRFSPMGKPSSLKEFKTHQEKWKKFVEKGEY